MTAPLPPGERPTFRTVAPAPLLTAALCAVVVVGVVSRAPDSVRLPLAWGAGAAAVLLCAAVAVAARSAQASKLARRRLDTAAADAGRLLRERARMAEDFGQERTRLTGEFAQERARLAEEAARDRVRLTEEFVRERALLTEEFTQERMRFTDDRARLAEENIRLAELSRQTANARDTAVSATANAAGRMQALATGMLADLREMEERHSDEEVLADLLHLDHRTAQAGRLADSVAVLAGARTGRRWARPIVMESILRGAMGRISGYQRVRVHSASEAAVSGHAAEGVMHALAELLDNAANFSPPTAEVHVYVEQVPAGVIVSVEDSGLVMGDVQLRRAERAVSGDTTELGGLTGTRLGLAVVGRLARKHGLTVSFRPSARGGTGVLMLIPQDLLAVPASPLPAEPQPAATRSSARPAPADVEDAGVRPHVSYAAGRAVGDLDPDPVPTHDSPARSADADADADASTDVDPDSTGGLPRRHRGHTLAAAERDLAHAANTADTADRTDGSFAAPAPAPGTDADADADGTRARAARFSSFRQAVRGPVPDGSSARHGTAGSHPAGGATSEENAARPSTPATQERAAMETTPGDSTWPASAGPHPAPYAPSPSHPEGDTTP